MAAHITNPRGAYGQRADEAPTGQITSEYEASAAITLGQVVAITYTPSTGKFTVAPTTATTDQAIGVATRSVDTGETVKVVTSGPALVRATASQTAGSTATTRAVSGSAAGRIVASPATLGHRTLGFVLENMTGLANDALVAVYVTPHTAYAS